MLAAVYSISGGAEFTYDVSVSAHLAGAPFEPFTGTRYWAGQYPPLQGMAEAVFFLPLRYFMGEFMAIRLTFIIWEAVAVFLAWLCINRMQVPERMARMGMLLLVIMPAGWMTSAVMAQDEFIAGSFLAGSVFLWMRGKRTLAIVLCGLGVGAGKIFLVLPLLGLMAAAMAEGAGGRPLLAGAVASSAPYLIVALAATLKGQAVPLLGFTPPFDFSTGIWNLASGYMDISRMTAKRASTALGLFASLAPLCWLMLKGELRGISMDRLALTLVVMLMWFFNIFYHVNPEYYALVLPLMVLALRDIRAILSAYFVLSLPWAVNLFYGLMSAIESGASGGQGGFIRLFEAVLPGGPGDYLKAALIISVICNLALTAWFTAILVKSRDHDHPEHG